jgi:hypothetical protein
MEDVKAQRDEATKRVAHAESEVIRLRALLSVLRATLAQADHG